MVWLTGGVLVVLLAMICGLIAIVLGEGLSTFWPGAVVRVHTLDGRTYMGEQTDLESFEPQEHDFDALSGADRELAQERVAAADGEGMRRQLRTGNFQLTNEHTNWIADFELTEAGPDRPEWALVVERMDWGRFYGFPSQLWIDGEPVPSATAGPAAVWAAFEQHHEASRERWREVERIRQHEVGQLNARLEEGERSVRRAAGRDRSQSGSPAHRAAVEEFAALQRELESEFAALHARIAELEQENARYAIVLETADGRERRHELWEVVRAYPANQLGLSQKLGVYGSRWREFLTEAPRFANAEGGVWPAIFGTVVMTLLMTVLVVPFGVLAALYLREYARQGFVVSLVRIAVNNLAGVPSIVYGVFGLGFFCYFVGGGLDELFFWESQPNPTFGTGGILWASLTLALLTLPVVIVATEEALSAVPSSMREGSYACGATKWQTIRRIVLPRALPGILTGAILAIARGAGEVAPLMLTGALESARDLPIEWEGALPSLHLERSFMHLGFHIYGLGLKSQNSEAARPMVFTSTLLLIGIVLALNLAAIWLRGRLRRRYEVGVL